jgi:hypothetical protein
MNAVMNMGFNVQYSIMGMKWGVYEKFLLRETRLLHVRLPPSA